MPRFIIEKCKILKNLQQLTEKMLIRGKLITLDTFCLHIFKVYTLCYHKFQVSNMYPADFGEQFYPHRTPI